MALTDEDRSWIIGEIQRAVKQALVGEVSQLIMNELATHTRNVHGGINLTVLDSKVASLAAQNVLAVEIQKKFKERVDQIEDEIIPDEIGRAQDSAKEAKEAAEQALTEAKMAQNHADQAWSLANGISAPLLQWGLYKQANNGTWTTNSIYAPAPNPPTQIKTLTFDECEQLNQSVPAPDKAITALEGLFKDSEKLNNLVVKDTVGSGLELFAQSDERQVKMFYSPNKDGWDLSSVIEVGIIDKNKKTTSTNKKKGTKKNVKRSSK